MKSKTASPTLNPILLSTAILSIACALVACRIGAPPARADTPETAAVTVAADAIVPVLITEPSQYDTDDPAIWIHPDDPVKSLILGTDKNQDGAIYVFDLDGKILPEKTVRPLLRVNNIDIEYGLPLGGETIDIAVTTERGANKLRVYSLPEMKEIDNGGIDVFRW